ncbi:uncharacterized protein LOC131858374 [Cryptomeria japonica]|uniref:uncharacterized protein LOC131858374 n=1 Tax=Cryptomeria japonica TaxID=3369 RepID=UPI0027DA24CB|nr:uncharacterized protein LOC131858374 [Cryptomeria japonica]
MSISTPEWTLPEKGWIKINFDGASRGNPGASGVGVIARNDRGNILAIGAKRLVDGTSNVAESHAALEAILMAGKLGVKKLHLEGCSQVVVNGSVVFRQVGTSIEEVQQISSMVLRPKWIREKVTPIRFEAPLDEDGRPLVRHQLPKKSVKVVEHGSLCGSRPGTVLGGGSVTQEARPNRGIPNFSREEALGRFRI